MWPEKLADSLPLDLRRALVVCHLLQGVHVGHSPSLKLLDSNDDDLNLQGDNNKTPLGIC